MTTASRIVLDELLALLAPEQLALSVDVRDQGDAAVDEPVRAVA